jgi:tetratricopeptide (TPR) repeat protein
MESHSQLDAPGAPSSPQLANHCKLSRVPHPLPFLRRVRILFSQGAPLGAALFAALFFVLGNAAARSHAPSDTNQIARVKHLYDSGQWNAVIQTVPDSPDEPAELELYRGLALAHLHRWDDAKKSFETGLLSHPQDARLMVELAGVDYHQKDFARAKHFLRRALSIEPRDAYANNFLASIYFLQGNLDAALEYWNRAGKPRLADLSYSPEPALNSLILDRAFDFSRGSLWTRGQYLATQARLSALNLFPVMDFDLEPQPDDSFNLIFRAPQRTAWTRNYFVSAFTLLRGLPFETVYPGFYNINGSGLNSLSLLRWDDQKRRLTTEFAAPLFDNPALRYRLYFDARERHQHRRPRCARQRSLQSRTRLRRRRRPLHRKRALAMEHGR